MNFFVFILGFSGAILWELVEMRSDFLSKKATRVAARKSFGFWFLVAIISIFVGFFCAILLSGGSSASLWELNAEPESKGVVIASFFVGFGSIPALKSFKLLPIVNKVFGNIDFDDTATTEDQSILKNLRIWWAL